MLSKLASGYRGSICHVMHPNAAPTMGAAANVNQPMIMMQPSC